MPFFRQSVTFWSLVRLDAVLLLGNADVGGRRSKEAKVGADGCVQRSAPVASTDCFEGARKTIGFRAILLCLESRGTVLSVNGWSGRKNLTPSEYQNSPGAHSRECIKTWIIHFVGMCARTPKDGLIDCQSTDDNESFYSPDLFSRLAKEAQRSLTVEVINVILLRSHRPLKPMHLGNIAIERNGVCTR